MGLNVGPQGFSVGGQGALGGGGLSVGPQGFSVGGQGVLGGGSLSVGPQGAGLSAYVGTPAGGGMRTGGYGGGGYGGGMPPGGYGGGMPPGGYGGGMPPGGYGGGYGGGMPPGGYAGPMQAPGSAMGAPNGTSAGQAADSIKQGVGGAESATMQSMAAQDKLSALQQWASTQTALLKLRGDLNDAMNNFIKGVGSSIKSASQ